MPDVISLLESADPSTTLYGKPGPNNIMIRCPFHGGGQERSPSCSVLIEQPVFFCHGCKTGGHLTKLLAALGMPRDLARRMVDSANFSEVTGFTKRKGRFRHCRGPNPYRGEYILDEEFLDDWRLAPRPLLDAGFRKSTLRHFEVGFDHQNMRVTYPLRNVFGELVGVSGRTVIDQEPRYKLYRTELRAVTGVPEEYTLDGVKSALLWHAHLLPALRVDHTDPVIITEGFKAAMWVWQCGFPAVVATIGSYLSDLHANYLSHLRCPIILFYDNNEAGLIGTWKALKKLHNNKTLVASYPDQREQPDDLSIEEIELGLGSAQSYTEWVQENRDVIRQSEEHSGPERRFRSSR